MLSIKKTFHRNQLSKEVTMLNKYLTKQKPMKKTRVFSFEIIAIFILLHQNINLIYGTMCTLMLN